MCFCLTGLFFLIGNREITRWLSESLSLFTDWILVSWFVTAAAAIAVVAIVAVVAIIAVAVVAIVTVVTIAIIAVVAIIAVALVAVTAAAAAIISAPAATAAAAAAGLSVFRFLHDNSVAIQIRIVQFVDCGPGLVIVRHFNKAESSGFTREMVHNYFG